MYGWLFSLLGSMLGGSGGGAAASGGGGGVGGMLSGLLGGGGEKQAPSLGIDGSGYGGEESAYPIPPEDQTLGEVSSGGKKPPGGGMDYMKLIGGLMGGGNQQQSQQQLPPASPDGMTLRSLMGTPSSGPPVPQGGYFRKNDGRYFQ